MKEDQLKELIKIYQSDPSNQDVLGQITDDCLGIIKHLAGKIWKKIQYTGAMSSTSFEDLEAEGFLGLVDALKGFDLSRQIKFTTYAPPRIRGAMLDYLRRIDVSRVTRSHLNAYARAQEISGKANPDPEEIATALEIKMGVAKGIFRTVILNGKVSSTSTPTYELENVDGFKELGDSIPSEDSDSKRNLLAEDGFNDLVRGFNKEEKLILFLYYSENLTMKETGRHVGVSESRVSQVHSSCIKRLKSKLSDRKKDGLSRSFH